MSHSNSKDDFVNYEDKNNFNPLSKRINRILSIKLENEKDTIEALRELSSFYEENDMQTRRNLRGQIENRSVKINEKFVESLRDVKLAIDAIYENVAKIDAECNDMKSRLQFTKTETQHLINQTNNLQDQSQKLQLREEVVELFVKTFRLSSSEIESLQGGNSGSVITPEFFEALRKTQVVRNNTKYLLQTGEERTSLDIMEQLNNIREVAFDRLFRWTQFQMRSSHDPSGGLLPQSLAALLERPVLFNMVVDEWIVVRRGSLTKGFLDALTVGGPGGAPRPIELQAHDPLRYVGDILAWIHQALPAEKEFIVFIFSKCDGIDTEERIQKTISGVSESLCRPLKTRIDQVIVSEQTRGFPCGKKAVQLYKIRGLLHFYASTIKQVTGKSLLVSTLEELQDLSHKMFVTALHNEVLACCERIQTPGESLAPCSGVGRTISLLTEIITADTVGISATDGAEGVLSEIVNCVVDPLLNAINESASSLGSIESSIYLLNCFHQLHSALSLLQTSPDKLERIQGQIDAQLDTLSQEQIGGLFGVLELTQIYPVITACPSPVPPLSAHPACQPIAIQTFVSKLDSFLASPEYLMLPHMRYLLSSNYRREIQERTSKTIISTYSLLYSLVFNPEHLFKDPETLLSKTPDDVRGLLL